MARLYPLFSSSKGNAAFAGTPESGVLIDCGVSLKRLEAAMARCGLPMTAIKAVFITHDHDDHIKGLRVLRGKYPVPLYAQAITLRRTIERCGLLPSADCHQLVGSVTVCGMTLTPFSTSHDTEQSCGFRIQYPDGSCCAVCTDLGYISPEVDAAIVGCNLVLLEANYDPDMLRCGRYPADLKARIFSDHGHLSNEQCAAQARRLVETGTTRLLLGHLSQDNNTPQHAENAVLAALAGYVRGQDFLLDIAKPETSGEMTVF